MDDTRPNQISNKTSENEMECKTSNSDPINKILEDDLVDIKARGDGLISDNKAKDNEIDSSASLNTNNSILDKYTEDDLDNKTSNIDSTDKASEDDLIGKTSENNPVHKTSEDNTIDAEPLDDNRSVLRKRGKLFKSRDDSPVTDPGRSDTEMKTEKAKNSVRMLKPGSYWLTRVVFLRSLGFIYGVAFLIAYNQNKELIGNKGILPAKLYMIEKLQEYNYNTLLCASFMPSILWFFEPWDNLDFMLDVIALIGMSLSLAIFMSGSANMVSLWLLWILYHSVINIGQVWYGFGWESQLLETGFLSIWIVPFLMWKQYPSYLHVSWIFAFGYRWLVFRIILGAGLIKLRGDPCWKDFTCMNYHYETQPVPNPLSYYLHQLPEWWHQMETVGNHIVELVIPMLCLLLPIKSAYCGIIQISFQVILIISGNLSFLNWLTIIPCIWFFDDHCLRFLFSDKVIEKVIALTMRPKKVFGRQGTLRRLVTISVTFVIGYLSVPVMINMSLSTQVMNTSFEPFRLVNTYGAFGSITKSRREVILQGTHSENPYDVNAQWLEYEFYCKPGDTKRRPCVITPYHYRLDWLMWFAGFQKYQPRSWLTHFVGKLLINDPAITAMIAYNPFEGVPPPKFIRGEHYGYKYTTIGSEEAKNGHWWNRRHIGTYMSPQSTESLAKLGIFNEYLPQYEIYDDDFE